MTSSTEALPFTGERFTPECVREIWYEHVHRYALAATHASGKRVLDAACGEGFGSAMLARAGAASVLGIDIDGDAIAHATKRYARDALVFRRADVTALNDLPSAGFDLICSFETLEHVEQQETLVAGFARLLAPGGLLLLSTPDRRTYSDLTGFQNPYHVRELYLDEFRALVDRHFPHSRLLGQKLLFQSVIWNSGDNASWQAHTEGGQAAGLQYPPLYWIAACAHRADTLDALPSLHLFGDAAESMYRHYEDEIRKGIRAGHRILELEHQVAELAAELQRIREGDHR